MSSPWNVTLRAEDRVLERILLLRDLRRDDAGLAGLAQPVQPLVVLAARGALGVAEGLDLRSA